MQKETSLEPACKDFQVLSWIFLAIWCFVFLFLFLFFWATFKSCMLTQLQIFRVAVWIDEASIADCRGNELRQEGKETDKSESGDRGNGRNQYQPRQRLVSTFPRHSDFILATNKERPLCVSMVTPCSSNDGEDKGAGKKIHFGLRQNIFLLKFCWV